jgi:hypothetical protein
MSLYIKDKVKLTMGNCLEFTSYAWNEHVVSETTQETPWFSFETLFGTTRPMAKVLRVLGPDDVDAGLLHPNGTCPVIFVVGLILPNMKAHRALKAYLIMDRYSYKENNAEAARQYLVQNCMNALHTIKVRDWGIVNEKNALVLIGTNMWGPKQEISSLMYAQNNYFDNCIDNDADLDSAEPSIVDHMRHNYLGDTGVSSSNLMVVRSPPEDDDDVEIVLKEDLP